MHVEKADYILVIAGRVMASGNDVEQLMNLFDLENTGGGFVKSFRLHHWIDGIPKTIFSDEHCEYCKATRQRYGRLDDQPCQYPERSGDPTVEVFKYHAKHTDTRCCPEHNHHAKLMHVGCMLR